MMMVSEAIAGLEDGERFQAQVLAQLASEPSSERPSVELVDTMAVYAKTLVDLRTKAEDLLDSIRGRL